MLKRLHTAQRSVIRRIMKMQVDTVRIFGSILPVNARGYSLMVEPLTSNQITGVRFSVPAQSTMCRCGILQLLIDNVPASLFLVLLTWREV